MAHNWKRLRKRMLTALTAALFAAARLANAEPIQWGGGSPCGSFYLDDSETGCWVYEATIWNNGTSDADNMVGQTLSFANKEPLTNLYEVAYLFANGSEQVYWTNADGSVSFNQFVPSRLFYNLQVYLRVRPDGRVPGRLRLSATSLDHGPFNDLIIGPPYAPPTLALARAASTGPGTNAVTLAVASDAETFLIQYRDTLSATNWTDLRRCAVTGAVTVATDTNTAPARFYRAVVP